jgi:hypothetical protein
MQVQITNLLPVVEAEVLPVYALAWHRVLEDVPTNRLDEYYLRAVKRKDNGRAVTATDIIAEWNRLTDQRRWDGLIADTAADRIARGMCAACGRYPIAIDDKCWTCCHQEQP